MSIGLFLIPIISAFIGWFAIWIAIKMLFHPREPRNILGFRFQGVFPKKQQPLAEKLGKLVKEQLLSFDEIQQKITSPENLQKIMPHIEEHIDQFLRVKLAERMPIISMFIGDKTISELKTVFAAELEILFPLIMQQYMGNLQEQLDFEKIVVDKIAAFSSEKLEQVLNESMAKELRLVALLGGVLGFLAGLLQLLIISR